MLRSEDVFNSISCCKDETVRLPNRECFRKNSPLVLNILHFLIASGRKADFESFLLRMEENERTALLDTHGEGLLTTLAGQGEEEFMHFLNETRMQGPGAVISARAEAVLAAASAAGFDMVVQSLLDEGADAKTGNCLVSATGNGHNGVTKLLLEAGGLANPSAPFAWEIAVDLCDEGMVKTFLDAGVNTLDKGLSVAMHAAARSGNQRIVKLLVEYGASHK